MIQVIITDDHPIVREGIKNVLTGCPGITVAGGFDNAAGTLEALQAQEPDVLLLDINLPDMNGMELCKQICRKHPGVAIIILSVHDELPVIKSVLQLGAKGYVHKNAAGTEIITAVLEVMKGEIFLCSKTKEIMATESGQCLPEIPRITRREKEIIALVRKGLTTAEIAAQLFISTHTVDSHRKNLMEKFKVGSMTTVVDLAAKYNLLV